MSKTYYIPKNTANKNVDYITEFFISQTMPPKTSFSINFNDNEGFYVYFVCHETNPITVFKNDMEPVFKDSCVEFFANFYPDLPNSSYLNFEINSVGALLVRYRNRDNPKNKIECIHHFNGYVKPYVNKNSWRIKLFIPLDFIQRVYNTKSPIPNHFKGNVHKCSFNEDVHHAGSWNKIDMPNPHFHCPEFFGDFYIVD